MVALIDGCGFRYLIHDAGTQTREPESIMPILQEIPVCCFRNLIPTKYIFAPPFSLGLFSPLLKSGLSLARAVGLDSLSKRDFTHRARVTAVLASHRVRQANASPIVPVLLVSLHRFSLSPIVTNYGPPA